MNKKTKSDARGFVYSTNPDFNFKTGDNTPVTTPAPSSQKLVVKLDTRQRAGKAVTLLSGFIGVEDDLEDLGKKLKNHCGTGGSVKDGFVLVQGDQRDKVIQWLQKNGFANVKKM